MSLTVLGSNGAGGDYEITDSLRFRDSVDASLTRTPLSGSAGTTMTLSCWIKRGKLNHNCAILENYSDGSNFAMMGINGDRPLFYSIISGTDYGYQWSNQLRDVSAWYHLVWTIDTTNAVTADRIRLYINGERATSVVSSWGDAPLNYATPMLTPGWTLSLGRRLQTTSSIDGYLSEVNFVDGQALTADDFGKYDSITGVWKPVKYTGTYGTNGFYLPMKETQQATGFNTVLWEGNNGTQSISNVGFSPDLVWTKRRTTAGSNILQDTVRGSNVYLNSNSSSAEATLTNGITSFDSNGFTLGSNGSHNQSGDDYVAWCWDAGSSTVSNTNGSITSNVRANPDTGFSIVTYTGTGTTSTVGHGLSSAPDMIITKNRDIVDGWFTYHSSLGSDQYMNFWTTAAVGTTLADYWGPNDPTSSVFGIGTYGGNNTNGNNYIAYCFSEVSGFSKFGSYTGNGSTSGPTVTTGFTPAFVMMKRTDSTGNWLIFDRTRGTDDNLNDNYLYANASGVEGTSSTLGIEITSTGFVLKNAYNDANVSGGNYIYMAFADTRDAQFNFDASGNKNNWTANNINSNASSEISYDIINDVPSVIDEEFANYPILNLNSSYDLTTILNAGTRIDSVATGVWQRTDATMQLPTTGKYYWEYTCGAVAGGGQNYYLCGIVSNAETYPPQGVPEYPGYRAEQYGYFGHNGFIYNSGGNGGTAYGSVTYTTNDVIGVAIDMDAGRLWFSKNGVWVNSGDPTNPNDTNDATAAAPGSVSPFNTSLKWTPSFALYNGAALKYVNFGQTPFKYSMPSGYKKLNSFNLTDSTIVDGSKYMNTVLYTGDGLSSKTIDSFEFAPDLVWIKNRGSTYNHLLFDTIRGADRFLKSNETAAEGTTTYGNQFLSNGYEFNTASVAWNENGVGHVMWGWRGSDSAAVSNTDGTITSTVSANTSSGFSIVTYTGNSTAGSTVGHGLSAKPDMILLKSRSDADNWRGYHSALGATKDIILNTTSAASTNSSRWNNTEPTSSVFTIGIDDGVNENGDNFVAYCWHSVEGYSKFGSYTGNGSADGSFVYTGFRPAFVMFKRTDSTGNWIIGDIVRNTYNAVDNRLYPDSNAVESSSNTLIDSLSNGFKLRNTTNPNDSGAIYIYMAFAENPFKNSLAR